MLVWWALQIFIPKHVLHSWLMGSKDLQIFNGWYQQNIHTMMGHCLCQPQWKVLTLDQSGFFTCNLFSCKPGSGSKVLPVRKSGNLLDPNIWPIPICFHPGISPGQDPEKHSLWAPTQHELFPWLPRKESTTSYQGHHRSPPVSSLEKKPWLPMNLGFFLQGAGRKALEKLLDARRQSWKHRAEGKLGKNLILWIRDWKNIHIQTWKNVLNSS